MRNVRMEFEKNDVTEDHHTTSEYALRQDGGCSLGLKSPQCMRRPARRLAMKSVISPAPRNLRWSCDLRQVSISGASLSGLYWMKDNYQPLPDVIPHLLHAREAKKLG